MAKGAPGDTVGGAVLPFIDCIPQIMPQPGLIAAFGMEVMLRIVEGSDSTLPAHAANELSIMSWRISVRRGRNGCRWQS